MLVAEIMPPLRKMSFSDGAIVWMLVNGACPGSHLEMRIYSFSGRTETAPLLILGRLKTLMLRLLAAPMHRQPRCPIQQLFCPEVGLSLPNVGHCHPGCQKPFFLEGTEDNKFSLTG